MASLSDISSSFAADARSLDAARLKARQDPAEGTRFAARQFEALFLGMVLKAMREATPQGGLFDSEATRLYGSLLDQQLAQTLSARGGLGFARMIEQQLGRNAGLEGAAAGAGVTDGEGGLEGVLEQGRLPTLPFGPSARESRIAAAMAAYARATRSGAGALGNVAESPQAGSVPGAADPLALDGLPSHVRDFVSKTWPHAAEASRTTGVPAHFLVAQAALETGWGRSEPRRADGQPSYNVFGIKAGTSWSGPTVEATTVEYEGGVSRRENARFRAYGSYAESFRDYARLLTESPRYAAALGQQDAGAFARALQSAGYATDPAYAEKITRIVRGGLLGGRSG